MIEPFPDKERLPFLRGLLAQLEAGREKQDLNEQETQALEDYIDKVKVAIG